MNSQEQFEPVAWRYRYHKDGTWILTSKAYEGWAPRSFEQQPLYTQLKETK